MYNRYLQAEYEDAQSRVDFKRQRQLIKQGESSNECEQCFVDLFCCFSSVGTKGIFSAEHAAFVIFVIFAIFAVIDFILSYGSQTHSWYQICIGEKICMWSPIACTIWIALVLGGILAAIFSIMDKILNSLKNCFQRNNHNDVVIV